MRQDSGRGASPIPRYRRAGILYNYDRYLPSPHLIEEILCLRVDNRETILDYLVRGLQEGRSLSTYYRRLAHLLDLGGGTGFYGYCLAQSILKDLEERGERLDMQVTVFDYNIFPAVASRQSNFPQIKEGIYDVLGNLVGALPFRTACYSIVLSKDVLPHIPPDHLWGLFSEIHRVLIDGGIFFLIYHPLVRGPSQYSHNSQSVLEVLKSTRFKEILYGLYRPSRDDWYKYGGPYFRDIILAKK